MLTQKRIEKLDSHDVFIKSFENWRFGEAFIFDFLLINSEKIKRFYCMQC